MLYDHIISKFPANRVSELLNRAPMDANDPTKLSLLTGISVTDIALMDSGELEPTLNMAYKLAAAFRIPIENMFADQQDITFVY